MATQVSGNVRTVERTYSSKIDNLPVFISPEHLQKYSVFLKLIRKFLPRIQFFRAFFPRC